MLRASALLLATAAIVLLQQTSSGVAAVDLALFNDTSAPRCMASQLAPAEPRPLEFCYWLNDRSCCTPANDAAAKEAFTAAVGGLGAGCAPTDHKMRRVYREVRQFACLACDPREPEYRQWFYDTDNNTKSRFQWKVCLSFFFGKDGNGGLWRGNGKRFDECGYMSKTADGSEFIVPSVAYKDLSLQQIAEQFGAVLPSFVSGFEIVVVNDTENPLEKCFASASSLLGSGTIALLLLTSLMFLVFGAM